MPKLIHWMNDPYSFLLGSGNNKTVKSKNLRILIILWFGLGLFAWLVGLVFMGLGGFETWSHYVSLVLDIYDL